MTNICVRLHPRIDQRLDRVWVLRWLNTPCRNLRFVGDEERVQMSRYETGRGLLTRDDVNDVLAVEVALVTKKLFFALIVVILAIHKLGFEVTKRIERQGLRKRPTSERSSRILDVILGVVSDSHRKQFQDLTTIVLVDRSSVILVVVEPEDHRRVSRKFQQNRPEVAQSVVPEHLDVIDHAGRVLALGPSGRQDAMPEQRHLLLQRTLGVDHPKQPPTIPHRAVVFVRG